MMRLSTKTYTGLPRASVEYEIRLMFAKAFILLEDLDEPGSRSLTNDMEAVVEDLKVVVKNPCDSIIIYKDSEGCYDLVVCQDYGTVGFEIYAAQSFEEAAYIWAKNNSIEIPENFVKTYRPF